VCPVIDFVTLKMKMAMKNLNWLLFQGKVTNVIYMGLTHCVHGAVYPDWLFLICGVMAHLFDEKSDLSTNITETPVRFTQFHCLLVEFLPRSNCVNYLGHF